MRVVIVTFDRLATSALGCYGNEWIETPHFDRLASQGVVFDQHFATTVASSVGMESNAARSTESVDSPSVEQTLAWATGLVSPHVSLHLLRESKARSWSQSLPCRSRIEIDSECGRDPQPDQIPFARLVQAARERLLHPVNEGESQILWLHSAGVPEPCWPPSGFASLYFDEYEERGWDMSTVTPDNWETHPAVYAGYVSLIDHWLGELMAAVGGSSAGPTLCLVTAAQGSDWMKPLMNNAFSSTQGEPISIELESAAAIGEQLPEPPRIVTSAISPEVNPLADAITRTPLILRMLNDESFDCDYAGTRSNRLVVTEDLFATVIDFCRFSPPTVTSGGRSLLRELSELDEPREAICFTHGTEWRGIRTANWSCIVFAAASSTDSEPTVRLFVKPEDLWDVNDVSGQHREIAASLVTRLNESLPSSQSGR